MTKILTAIAMGDVPEYLAEEGLENAQHYFDINELDPFECCRCFEQDQNSVKGKHWVEAGRLTNSVLAGNRLYDNSMISLEFEA